VGADLAHLEVLGPRAGLDGWLATLQTAGTCHLADALVGLAGEPGIGRPRPRDEERRAADLRAPVLSELRSLAAILPARGARADDPAHTGEPGEWTLPPGGVDEDALAVRCERVLGLARRIRRDLEGARGTARSPDDLERARAALATRLAGEGLEARRALDGLEDAEAREDAQRLLASTGHVAAARIYVPKVSERDLLARLERAHGAAVVARPLPLAEDAPGPVRALPAAPLSVLRSRFGEHSPLALVVLCSVPLAALLARDALVGLLLVVGGVALRVGARRGSPRRDVAWLALTGGFVGLVAGALQGRLAAALTDGLGRGSQDRFLAILRSWVTFWQGITVVAFVLAVTALVLALRHANRGEPGPRARMLAFARRLALLGFLCLLVGWPGDVLHAAATGAYVLALFILLPLRGFGRVALDALGALKAVAVSGLALLAFGWALEILPQSTWPAGVVGLLAAACVLVLEAASYAMGDSYSVVLGEHGAAPEFMPFARHGSRAPAPGGEA
jgi:hypothetical protein